MVGFQNNSVFGEAGQTQTGKSDLQESAGANHPCPQCNSAKLWKDGLRSPMFGDPIQRWLCRDCGYRFSDPEDVERAWNAFEHVERLESKTLKSDVGISSARQICVSETKNLVAEQETVLEVPQRTEVNLKGAIVDFLWQLKRKNYAEDTLSSYGYNLQELIELGVNLFDPQSFIDKMTELGDKKTNVRKYTLAKAYKCFLNYHKIEAQAA